MVTEHDIKTYTVDGVFWVEATDEVEASSSTAWEALEGLVVKLTEEGTSVGTEYAVDEPAPGDSLVAEGTRIAALATALRIFKAGAVITFDAVQRGKRAHGIVEVLGAQQGEVEFVVEAVRENACVITFRQGTPDQETAAGLIETSFTAASRQVPEVVEIHNAWSELITGPRDESAEA